MTRVTVALWAPTITTVGTVVAAAIVSWSGCSDLRGDVQAIQRSVDLQTGAIDRLGIRVRSAEQDAASALASCRAKHADKHDKDVTPAKAEN